MTAVIDRRLVRPHPPGHPRRLAEFLDGTPDAHAARAAYMRAFRWWERLGIADRRTMGNRGPGSRAWLTERELLAIATACAVARSDTNGWASTSGQRGPTEAGERAGLAVLATTGRWLFANRTTAVVLDSAEALVDLWVEWGRPPGAFLNLATVPCPNHHPINQENTPS